MQVIRWPRFAASRLNVHPWHFAGGLQRGECSVSLLVLAAAGLLTCAAPGSACAQAAGTVLPPTTVPVLRGVVSGQAVVNAPTATSTGQLLTINQQSTRAIIDWEKFNIGSGSEVRFIQPSAVASVLNRIYSLDPSIIQGKLSANGQVLLINQNGILFDRGTQINVNALVASTLNISNEAYASGLAAGGTTTPAFKGGYRIDGGGVTDLSVAVNGAVRIGVYGDPSAPVPVIKANPGGNILVFAPVIDNRNGLITSPDGQVILAAGSKAYLSDLGVDGQGVRGLLVEVSADAGPVDLTSLIRNQGMISADRGNVTLAGLSINQAGRVSASTAVLYNGSVWLKARTVKEGQTPGSLVTERSGRVELAAGSVTETLLDTTDKTKVTESTPYASANRADDKRGAIRIEGGTIAHRGTLRAPGGRIDLTASDGSVPGNARIYLDDGSLIDAAGNWAELDYASNLLTFKVTSNELKDAPLQKDGVLRGQTVTVDLRKGSPILDLSGYIDGRLRGVAEKATAGGDVAISSTGSLVQRVGASVDVSGGGYRYGEGRVATSQLLGEDGRSYDIGAAPKDRRYTMVLDQFTKTDKRWGQSEVFAQISTQKAATEAAYVEGRRGGTLVLTAREGMVLDGHLRGGAVSGATQLASATRGGSLVIGTNLLFADTTVPVSSVTFSSQPSSSLRAGFDADSTLSSDLKQQLTLSTDTLFGGPSAVQGAVYDAGRFDSVEINSRGLITLPRGVELAPGIESTLTLRAQEIDIGGKVSAPSGNVTLQTAKLVNSDSTPQPLRITLRPEAEISTAGLWLNNASRDGSPVGPVLPSGTSPTASGAPLSTLSGGSISLSAASLDLQPGSALDVSGGGRVARNNAITGGNAGTIAISADAGAGVPASSRFGADLRGYSISAGGSLSIALGQMQIGGGVAPDGAYRFDSDLFQQGGFRTFDFSGARGLTVVKDTRIEPVVESWVLDPFAAAGLASGSDLASIATRTVLPEHERRPTNVTLRARGSSNATIKVRAGAAIVTQAGGAISLDARDGIEVDGRLQAPGGSINLTLNGRENQAPSMLHLGESAQLLADGAYIARPNDLNLRQGSLTAGGAVTLNATRASVVVDAGSRISVDGAAQWQDIAGLDPDRPYSSVLRYSNAGSVVVKAQDGVRLNGTLSGRAPAPQAAGGSFALELTNREDTENVENTQRARRIVVTQAPAQIAAEPGFTDGQLAINSLVSSGFDKLRVAAEDRIELRGRTSLDFTRGVWLDAPEFLVVGDGRTSVSGTSVVLANSFGKRSANGGVALDNGDASKSVNTVTGLGTFNASGRTVDLYGDLTINGVQASLLSSENDLRLTGRVVGSALTDPAGARLTGSLTTAGDLTLAAAQIYPSTRSNFTIAVADHSAASSTTTVVPGGELIVKRNGNLAGTVFSAGGKLALRADTIQQAGVVKAPLGEIDLDATTKLELTGSSVTSVSAAGTTIPYGSTVAGVSWLYGTTNATVNVNDLKAAPGKRVSLSGATVDLRDGAVVDVSGGGEVLATEFVPGSGGTTDLLRQENTFAVIPTARLTAMPVDTEIAKLQDVGFGLSTLRQERSVYDSIHIGPGSLLPEGDYALLPGRYALLPGAYLVQLQTTAAYSSLPASSSQTLPSGLTVVSGYRTAAGTAVRESQTVGVVVRPGAAARKESDYNLTGSEFFANLAVQERRNVGALPSDAGAVAISAGVDLRLAGTFKTAPAASGARAAEVDIAADRIAIVDRLGQPGIEAGYLQVEASKLSAIQGSVLVGGIRIDDDENVKVVAGASQLLVANSAAQPLQVPELLLAASDRIEVRSGSVLSGSGATAGRVRDISAEAGGALVRLSNAAQVVVDRGSNPNTTRGEIDFQAGATLTASKSMVLDATKSTVSGGDLQLRAGGSLSLAAGNISLGGSGADAGVAGLSLTNAQLAQFNSLESLALKSYGGIDLLGNVQVGSAALKQLTFDTSILRGVPAGSGPTTAQVRAAEFQFINSGSTTAAAATGTAVLNIDTQRLALGAGDKAIAGFAVVNLSANGDVVADGSGSLRAAADLNIRSTRIVSSAGADQRWQAVDDSAASAPIHHAVVLTSIAAQAGMAPVPSLGSKLAVEGKSVRSDARITMSSGTVSLTALGSDATDDVRLSSGAIIDVAGRARSFNGVDAATDAGQIRLQAVAGGVAVEAGAAIRLDAGDETSRAGALGVSAQRLQLSGSATSAGGASGRFTLDVNALDDFSSLNNWLNAGGFGQSRHVRVRQGDLLVATSDTVKAREIGLAADTGRIDIEGKLDASATQGGGSVAAYAREGIRVAGTGLIDASGSAAALAGPPAKGGHVQLDVRKGTLALLPGARIDVRGAGGGSAGKVTLTAPRTAGNDGIRADLRGTVLSQRNASDAAAEVSVEARRVYQGNDTAAIGGYATDHLAFMSRVDANAIKAGLRGDNGAALTNVHVRGSLEVQTGGDFATSSDWVLTTGTWLAGGEPGTLTVRAAGDLTVSHALGFGNDNVIDTKSWNLRLIGGADLAAANPMATLLPAELAGKGNVTLEGPNAKVRTGTGSINIAAGHNFALTDSRAVVYTTGRSAAANPANLPASPNPAGGVDSPWLKEGGSIRISAQHDALGTSNQSINEWLRRPRGTVANSRQSGWWAFRPNFRQNIATFGGGDIEIIAGRNVDNLSAMSSTSGRVSTVESAPRLDVQGGGMLRVDAGNDILGGGYLVGRGAGSLRAGGKVGLDRDGDGALLKRATQVYLMGESDDPASRQASLRIDALGDIALQSVDNPTVLAIPRATGQGVNFGVGSSSSYFYTYAQSSRIDLGSLTGDISLGSAPLNKPLNGGTDSSGSAYPASLSAIAFAGTIRGLKPSDGGSLKPLEMFPSSTGTVRLLAERDVVGLNLVVSDRDPATVAGWSKVETANALTGNQFLATGPSSPRLVARPGAEEFAYDIQALTGSLRDSSFVFPAVARLRAGGDITGLSASLQNLTATEQSVIQADAGDIRPTGGISIAGPGVLLVQAGRNVDLRTALTATGNANNASLSTSRSARLVVVAGVNGALDIAKLDAAYLELIEAGKLQDDKRAQTAMKAFFGDTLTNAGDISSYLTSVQTFGGSDVDLLAPKGNITVGLTTPSQATVGVVTNTGGAIRSYLGGNFNINQGKVVTAQGGDILIYAAKGNIDAGRGARTSTTTPAPQRVPIVDNEGVVVGFRFVLPTGVSGSGIQTVTSDPDGPGPLAAPLAGSVYLFAPSGFVDAGEAGIVSGANIFIAAQAVLNASNISSAGTSVGVPIAAAGSLASSLATGGTNTTSTSTAAEEASKAAAASARAASAEGLQKPTILVVEVLGFGDKNCKEQDKNCFAK